MKFDQIEYNIAVPMFSGRTKPYHTLAHARKTAKKTDVQWTMGFWGATAGQRKSDSGRTLASQCKC